MSESMIGKKVLVTTDKRGVFFGTLEEFGTTNAILTGARSCIYWSEDVRGFLGLAANGPTQNCRIGPAAPRLALSGITSCAEVSDAAAAAWEAEPWK